MVKKMHADLTGAVQLAKARRRLKASSRGSSGTGDNLDTQIQLILIVSGYQK